MHDPSAVVFLMAPELFTTRDCPLRVETEGMSRGKTWPHLGGTDEAMPEAWRNRPLVSICTGVEARPVIEKALDRLM